MARTRRVEEHLFGNCWTGQLIENGAVAHEQSAEHWHHRCRGAVTNGDGSLVRCTCECHAEHQICLACGEPHQELGEDLRCLEKAACAAHVERRLSTNEIARQVREAQAGAQGATEQKVARVRRERVAVTGGRCECCGEPTKGGRFLPGHDSKLKSALRKRAAQNDEKAQQELALRGW